MPNLGGAGLYSTQPPCGPPITLSMTKAVYIAMIMVLHDTILLMELIAEMREHKFKIMNTQPYL
eukprot:CCRYP_006555-RA/>CCRYP_006555-RA protein AED:0.43 eAED:0.60 QI:0/0/0/1/0/0/2/0/63